jgi:hypothetical protein
MQVEEGILVLCTEMYINTNNELEHEKIDSTCFQAILFIGGETK